MSAKLINVALDLETLSTQENAAIIQIGCCIPEFDRKYLPEGISHEFEVSIKYEEALAEVRAGVFHHSTETMLWWDKQDARTRAAVFSGQDDYCDALDQLEFWLDSVKSGGAEVAIWGNGSDFDNRLLAYTISAKGYKPMWNFRNNRDLRTLKAFFPVEIAEDPVNEVKHTALGDSRYEARLLNAIHDYHKSVGWDIL